MNPLCPASKFEARPPRGIAPGPAAQATRHLGLKSEQLNHAFFIAGCLLFAALSLPIDGADWAAQLGPWTAGDWLILLALGSVCYLGSAAAVQVPAVQAVQMAALSCGSPQLQPCRLCHLRAVPALQQCCSTDRHMK